MVALLVRRRCEDPSVGFSRSNEFMPEALSGLLSRKTRVVWNCPVEWFESVGDGGAEPMSDSPSAVTNDVGDLGESRPAVPWGPPVPDGDDGEALSATMLIEGMLGGSPLFDGGIVRGSSGGCWKGGGMAVFYLFEPCAVILMPSLTHAQPLVEPVRPCHCSLALTSKLRRCAYKSLPCRLCVPTVPNAAREQ
jgi:hypothetical protein